MIKIVFLSFKTNIMLMLLTLKTKILLKWNKDIILITIHHDDMYHCVLSDCHCVFDIIENIQYCSSFLIDKLSIRFNLFKQTLF